MPLRHALAALALLAAVPASAQPTWVELNDSPFNDYRSEDIWFANANLGWAVDGDGRVHRTTDSGATWAQTASVGGYLRSVAFVSPTVGFVGTVGSIRKLYETRDGGRTFVNISSRIQPATHGICSLVAVNEEVVYGAGTYNGPAVFIKTVDGGATWTSRSLLPHLHTVIDLHFFDENRGLAVGGTGPYGDTTRPRVIETTDGGETWTVRHTVEVSPGWGWKLSFPTPEVGFVSVEKYDGGPDSIILKTVDGGRTWTEIVFHGGGGNMQGIGFLTPDTGWVSGRGFTSRTDDGGATWTSVPDWGELDANVNRFVFLEGGLGFAAGHKIHRLDARPTATDPAPEAGGLGLSVGPNPAQSLLRIRYAPTATAATVVVFDALGREVGRVRDAAGSGVLDWPVPEALPAGIYSVRLQAQGRVETQAVSVVR